MVKLMIVFCYKLMIVFCFNLMIVFGFTLMIVFYRKNDNSFVLYL
jgi:hypothetical protein